MNTSTDQTPPEEEQVDDPCIPNHLDLGGTKHMDKRTTICCKEIT